MLTIENPNGTWLDRLLNRWPLLRDTDDIRSLAVAWLFKEDGRWVFAPRLCDKTSLFYNAVFFVRVTNPGLFISFRWSESSTAKAMIQCGAGWKLNGRIALLLRIQSDQSSAAGVSSPNLGQATGWNFGTH